LGEKSNLPLVRGDPGPLLFNAGEADAKQDQAKKEASMERVADDCQQPVWNLEESGMLQGGWELWWERGGSEPLRTSCAQPRQS